MGHLGEWYSRAYNLICGEQPNLRPWHFQWLAVKDLYADLRRVLPQLKGRVLDVGCGEKPYEAWLERADQCIGIDVVAGARVDALIAPGERWPVEDASIDAVLCTQVLEHVAGLDKTLEEVDRVLKPGGRFVVTVPFVYNEHGAPEDFRRFSVHGLTQLLTERYEVVQLKRQGGIGSTLGLLALNWIEVQMGLYKPTRLVKGALLPIWVALCGVVNGLGWLMDKVDRTEAFYSNVLIIAEKRCA
jgi:SAM-dependent methyltransferase